MRKVACERVGDTLFLRNTRLYDPCYPPTAGVAVLCPIFVAAPLWPVLALILAVVVTVFHIRAGVHGMETHIEVSDQWLTASSPIWSCRIPRDAVLRLALEHVPNGSDWSDHEETRWLPVVVCRLTDGSDRRLFAVANADPNWGHIQTAIDDLNQLFVKPADRAAMQGRIRMASRTAATNNMSP